MKARNDRIIMARIRVKNIALRLLLSNQVPGFDYGESFAVARIGGRRFSARAVRVGANGTWYTYPPPRSGSVVFVQ
jgi:hypothetical protein